MSFPVPSRLVGAVHWPWRGLCHDHRDQPDGVGQVGGSAGDVPRSALHGSPCKRGLQEGRTAGKGSSWQGGISYVRPMNFLIPRKVSGRGASHRMRYLAVPHSVLQFLVLG